MMRMRAWVVVLVATVVVVAAVGLYIGITRELPVSTSPSEPPPEPPPPSEPPSDPPPPSEPPERADCPRSNGLCIESNVTRVIDGDTLAVEGDLRVRLVLVGAPEPSEPGGPAAREFLKDLCLGSLALIDEDDFQIGADPFGRVLAVVYCDGTNANAAMLSSGHADTFYEFCAASEFGDAAWTGCSSAPPPPPPLPPDECDPAYPEVCIPSPPPDLDCGDIPYRNFVVLPPDPHHFDGDGDGIGCET